MPDDLATNTTSEARPGATAIVSPDSPAGYELMDEIGRGGMGVVYRARDVALDRDVAVKLLAQRYPGDSPAAQRFLSEARITGQLQHPGIPAVHQVGILADGRPFLAMKLIKGNTLESILKNQPEASAGGVARPESSTGVGRGRLLAIFEAVCQAVGYAHAHRVIHRDLKPANVMVGAFGEVQVMDWGLAKVLGAETPATVEALAVEQTRAWTQISPTPESASHTQAGSLVGTPAFSPPEQALGEIEKVKVRSDVFGLGALLAVILTGKPPYLGETAEAVRVQAARGKLDDCFTRLDSSGAEPELVALCKQCLAFEPAERPRDGGEVAQAVAALRAQAEQRARQAELDRVRLEGERAKAEAEVRAQRAKRRTQLAVAAGLVGLLVVGAGAWLSVRSQAAARRADADRSASVALGRTEQLTAQARVLAPGTVADAKAAVALWEQADAAVTQAEAAAETGTPDAALRVAEQAVTVRDGVKKARRDAALLQALEVVKSTFNESQGGTPDGAKRIRLFRTALSAADLPSRLPQKEDAVAMATAIRAEQLGVRTALLTTLDQLLMETPPCGDGLHDGFEFAAWLEVADRCDDHAFRREVRKTCHAAYATFMADEGERPAPTAPPLPNPPVRRAELIRLMDRAEREDAPVDAILMICRPLPALETPEASARSLRLLRTARDRHPGDFRIHQHIGWNTGEVWWATGDPRAAEETLASARMTIALRPDSDEGYYGLGTMLCVFGDNDQAVRYLRLGIERSPKFTFAHINLATALYYLGDLDAAEKVLRQALQIDPKFGRALSDLGKLQWARGDFEAAAQNFMRACESDPTHAPYVAFAATMLATTGRYEQAQMITRLWLEQAKKDDPRRPQIEAALKKVERAAALEAKVSSVLAGQDPAASSEERILLAERCFCLGHDAAAARLYAAALAADPALAAFSYRLTNQDVCIRQYEIALRYKGALAAARAGCEASEDSRRLTRGERAILRARALEWLRAELAVMHKQAAAPEWSEKLGADFHMRLWLVEPAFAGLRPGSGRVELSADEQAAWEKFWSEVRDTIALARQPPPQRPRSQPMKP